jgi:hypothetical protein
MNKTPGVAALAGIADLDRVVHEPARLAIVALLYVIASADFTFVMNQTGLPISASLKKPATLQWRKASKGADPIPTLN